MSVEETGSLKLFEGKQQEITRQELVERVSEHVNRILRRNLYELKLDEKQTFRLLRQKEELRRYLKEAGTGNLQVKEYLISFIQEFLLNGMKMDEEMIKHTFFFSEKGSRQAAVRFDILLFLYKEQYGSGAMEKLIEEHGLLSGTENVITEEQIEHVYGVCGRKLKFIEQIELLSRKIYAYYKGLGAIDDLRDMKIDGVSGGVSGKEGTYHSAWIFYHGRSVWLPFLDFEREEEMERISRNLCRYHQPGEISRKKGYLVHEMADHARVVVARPDFAENWMFFIRKLDNIPEVSLQQLVTGGHAEIPVELLKWLMKGCQVTAVTGMQGCGKTTLLTAMVGEIPEEYTIRVLELAFEGALSKQKYCDVPRNSGDDGTRWNWRTGGSGSTEKNRRSREHYRRGCQCKSGVMDDRERTDRFSVYDFYAPCKKYEKSSAVTSEQSVEGGQFSVGESCIRTGDGSGTF